MTWGTALRRLLPGTCPLCGAGPPGAPWHLCPACTAHLPRLGAPHCPGCALPFAGPGPDHLCPRCRREPPPFAEVRAWGEYRGLLAEAIQAFKFRARLALRRPLEALASQAAEGLRGVSGVVPVPPAAPVLRARGYDLPALLARRVARNLGAAWRPQALAKRHDAPELVGLSAGARARAAARSFRPREALAGRVLLVDDVVTTTATARACSRACLAAGAESVTVLALARTPEGGAGAA